jgi:hypothetical protein
MKSNINLLTILIPLIFILFLSSCTQGTTDGEKIPVEESSEQSSQTSTGITLITIDELLQLTESDENVVIVDVRSEAAYKLSHIEGAISVPESVIQAGEWEPPDGKALVLY